MSKIKLNLQHFAAEAGLTKAQNIQVTPRELDFVSVFSRNWEALTDIMGIMRPIQKQPGQVLKSKYAEVTLEDGDIGEGEQIPYSEATVKTKDYKELNLKKYKKAVSIEAILEHGYDTAVGMTDDEFMAELQFKVMDDYYAYLKTGTLKAKESNFQKALSRTQGILKNRWKEMHRTITSIVGFCNINDFYDWLGDQNIGPQIASQFGLNYLKNWMGYGTLFLCSDDEIPQGTVIATPVQNIVLYYVSPGHQDFARAGLNFVVDGITPLLGFNTIGNYNTDVSENNALMGMTLFSEYLDGIAVVSFGTVTDGVKVASESGSTTVFGTAVSDLQAGVTVGENAIKGTLKYYDDATKDIVRTWGEGNFLALKFTDIDPDATSVMVGLEPSKGSGLVELINDPDKNGVFKISDKDSQKFKVVTSDGKYSYTQIYDLSGLTLEEPAGA